MSEVGPPPVASVSVTEIACGQTAHGPLLFALCSDGSLWRLGDPWHTGVLSWAEILLPPPALRSQEAKTAALRTYLSAMAKAPSDEALADAMAGEPEGGPE